MKLTFSTDENARGAGILLHITSLPGPFGIGDLGPAAYAFADFLREGRQKYWQLLPLNPIEKGQGYSPYSGMSGMAGNPLLISPELLRQDGLLTRSETRGKPGTDTADYEHAVDARQRLLDLAWTRWKQRGDARQYNQFTRREAKWLDDFALFIALKERHESAPWYTWPEEYRKRKRRSLHAFSAEAEDRIRQVKWEQYVFFSQWKKLRTYCNDRGIGLIGDVPYYVSYDSADVWAHREIFAVNTGGKIQGVAGVPPDYFNADGQLWGMPVFRWNVLKKRKYDWWVDRMKKNLELYDVVRLDHFRAFSAYWEVAAGQKTAKKGKWRKGPGDDLFHALKKAIGSLPFIAEDLGDIDDDVRKLRSSFSLPGMKVLQFAFGDNHPESEYILHHHKSDFVVYTGTHDNNTTRGWFRRDAGPTERKNLARYVGRRITEKNVHEEMTRLAYMSVCDIAVIPLQDILGLDEKARMNTPASTVNTWRWRVGTAALGKTLARKLAAWAVQYNRA